MLTYQTRPCFINYHVRSSLAKLDLDLKITYVLGFIFLYIALYCFPELQHMMSHIYQQTTAHILGQLCPTRGPVEGFVRPSLGFRCGISSRHTDNL